MTIENIVSAMDEELGRFRRARTLPSSIDGAARVLFQIDVHVR